MYQDGFDRGVEGKSEPFGFLEGIACMVVSAEANQEQVEGWKAGLLARAIRDGEEED
jgi:hypothetical protein